MARTRTHIRAHPALDSAATAVTSDETLAEVARGAVPATDAGTERERLAAAPRVRIERIIQHQLDNATPGLLLAQAPSVLPPKTHDLFASYIAATAARADWMAGVAESDGPIARLCDALLRDETAFVEASQQLAERLFAQMKPRTISPGDLAVVVYQAGDDQERHVALLKLDPQVRQVRTFQRIGGRLRAVYDEANNTMPEEGHLQKCALLTHAPSHSGYRVVLLDRQAGPKAAADVAVFFYHRFLEVSLAPSPRRLTRRFVELCESWLDRYRDRFSPQQLFAFYAARRSALAGGTVEVARFAAEALDAGWADLRADLTEYLTANLVETDPPQRIECFAVDAAVVSRLRRVVTLELDGGARLSVRADQLASLLDMGRLHRVGNRYELVLTSLTLREVSD